MILFKSIYRGISMFRWRKMYWIPLMGVILLTCSFMIEPIRSTWMSRSEPMFGKVIVIDAGHGGIDGGAVSPSGIIEKDITLKIASYLQQLLGQAGAQVVMTRETDTDLANPDTRRISRRKAEDLSNRVRLVRESKAELFISIHLNSMAAGPWRGAQTFYNPIKEENKRLASLIQSEIIRTIANTDRLPKAKNDVFLMKYSPVPMALVEVGFLSNSEEARLLATEAYQKQVASAIYYGMLAYYDGKKVPDVK
ncbi:N-acetylmuramoyl-L-alanine amidase [Croceifilum oryzae]|uniref:N-acetylmuramoyl-L-alanine amidase n=1 Tax=Croceifilum oryzae TaxID=1553429 RepID=A0AAJ1TG00_9BACL|nr:N-acetylmuramoyl-L-alanine amidase CwlD [Croceifilum oryzae]MDQ0418173.1 N-acetylmuramoyl-L-alanine amidase [Croceifilum oryzae]